MKVKHGDILIEPMDHRRDVWISFVMDNPIYKTMKLLISLAGNPLIEDADIYSSFIYTRNINKWLKDRQAVVALHWEE